MYGFEELKKNNIITDTQVCCPVEGCEVMVERQRKTFKRLEKFFCPEHRIFISPSAFEYQIINDNLLNIDPEELAFLNRILSAKAINKMTRDNSEDTLSWNVFRFLERNALLEGYLSHSIGKNITRPHLIYWSFDSIQQDVNPLLAKARSEFGERSAIKSEPDLIIDTDQALFFIEAKFTAGNSTTPSNPAAVKNYQTGGGKWFMQVFSAEYDEIAIRQRKYELMRFWLLGTWMAEQANKKFYLVNLVCQSREQEIESKFKPLIVEDDNRKFQRWTWEQIYFFAAEIAQTSDDKDSLLYYFQNKTMGYRNGELIRAFEVK